MKELLNKLNYKDQRRIAVVNSEQGFFEAITNELKGVITDREIDQRCPYTFMMVFVRSVSEVEHYAPIALHNLTADGNLWFCFPRKTSKRLQTDIDRDNGWRALNASGFREIRTVILDDDWSAMKFRNSKFIKSASAGNDK